jgi:hypothetical protein
MPIRRRSKKWRMRVRTLTLTWESLPGRRAPSKTTPSADLKSQRRATATSCSFARIGAVLKKEVRELGNEERLQARLLRTPTEPHASPLCGVAGKKSSEKRRTCAKNGGIYGVGGKNRSPLCGVVGKKSSEKRRTCAKNGGIYGVGGKNRSPLCGVVGKKSSEKRRTCAKNGGIYGVGGKNRRRLAGKSGKNTVATAPECT